MSHKEVWDAIDREECSVHDLNHLRHLHAMASYVLVAFAGVIISKEEGLPGRHKDSQVSNASYVPVFTMRCSIAVKTVKVNYDIRDQHASSVVAHL